MAKKPLREATSKSIASQNYEGKFRAKTQQAAGRAANAATAQDKARRKMIQERREKLSALEMADMSAKGKESRDGIRGRRAATKKEIMRANDAYNTASVRGKTFSARARAKK